MNKTATRAKLSIRSVTGMSLVLLDGLLEGADDVPVAVVEVGALACVVAGAAKRMPLDVMTSEGESGSGARRAGLSRVALEVVAGGDMGVGVRRGGKGKFWKDSRRFASSDGTERREAMPLNVTRAFSQVHDMFV